MKMQTYLNYAGTCAEAFRYYEKHLGGKIGMVMTHGESPDQSRVTPEMKEQSTAREHHHRGQCADGRGHSGRPADAQRIYVLCRSIATAKQTGSTRRFQRAARSL